MYNYNNLVQIPKRQDFVAKLINENLQIITCRVYIYSAQFDSILHTLPEYCREYRIGCADVCNSAATSDVGDSAATNSRCSYKMYSSRHKLPKALICDKIVAVT